MIPPFPLIPMLRFAFEISVAGMILVWAASALVTRGIMQGIVAWFDRHQRVGIVLGVLFVSMVVFMVILVAVQVFGQTLALNTTSEGNATGIVNMVS